MYRLENFTDEFNLLGRTGRIGHRGVATSFFTERDDPLGSVLARTLLETNQEIPEFLSMYLPQGVTRQNLKFETESDFDPNDLGTPADFGGGDANGGAPDSAWGSGGNDAPAAPPADGSWSGGASTSQFSELPPVNNPPKEDSTVAPSADGGWGTTSGGDNAAPVEALATEAW